MLIQHLFHVGVRYICLQRHYLSSKFNEPLNCLLVSALYTLKLQQGAAGNTSQNYSETTFCLPEPLQNQNKFTRALPNHNSVCLNIWAYTWQNAQSHTSNIHSSTIAPGPKGSFKKYPSMYVLEQKHVACTYCVGCVGIISSTKDLLDFLNKLRSLRGIHLNQHPKTMGMY